MSPDEPLLWVLAKSIGGAAFLLHAMLTPVRVRAVRGTRHRYVFATLQRAVEIPALAAPVAFMAEAIRDDSIGDVARRRHHLAGVALPPLAARARRR